MKEEKMLEVLDHLGQVKEELILEAVPKKLKEAIEPENQDTVKQKAVAKWKNNGMEKIVRWTKRGVLAACLCIGVGVSIKAWLLQEEVYTDDTIKNDTVTMEKDYMKNDINTTEQIHDFNTTDTVIDTAMDKGFPNWGLSLSVKNVTPTGLTLVVTQSGGEPSGELQTGEAYRLIALVDGTWKTVEELPLPEGVDGRAWNSIAYWIPKGEGKEFEVDWNWIFGELPSGTYRFIKEFMDFRKTADYDTFEYWIEFEIE